MDYIKEAEKRLKHYRDMEKSIEQMDKDIARIINRSTPGELNAISMNITGVSSSKSDAAINILYELQTITEARKHTQKEIEDIAELLKDISREPDCRLYGKVLYLWYVKQLPKEQIADRIKYSVAQLYRIKNDAIRTFAVRILGIKALKTI